ncbi:MAG: TetR/AcrR family transcriptional regulator [Bradymonadia bacterium]
MARPSNTAQRRRQIIDALGRLLVQCGYDKATIPAITREAGLSSPGLVHYHFPNKHAILMGLVEQVSAQVQAHLSDDADSPADALPTLLSRLLGLEDGDRALAALWSALGAEAARNIDVQSAYRAGLDQLLEQLTTATATTLEARGRSTETARPWAVMLLSTIEGLFHLSRAAAGVIEEGDGARRITQLAEALLAHEPMGVS